MNAFWAVFRLELLALVRSKSLVLLVGALLAYVAAIPLVVTGDGTAEGMREVVLRYSLGGAFAILLIALLAASTGSFARERAARRLALTLVRPVRPVALFFAKGLALLVVGAIALALAASCVPFTASIALSRPAHHVLTPILPSVQEEAREAYRAYLADPNTPEAVRRAKKEVVLRLLEQAAVDRYESVKTNAMWRFDLPHDVENPLVVRLRFAGALDLRQDLVGVFRLGAREGIVSNMTQSVIDVPLHMTNGAAGETGVLSFENRSPKAVMLRPRRDLAILVPAAPFAVNLERAYLELVALLSLMIAFGLFLSATLSRPVALFVAMAFLALGEISPSVVETCREDLDAPLSDRVALTLTRLSSNLTRPLSSVHPIESLASDTYVETDEIVRVLAFDFVLVPLLLSLLAAFALSRSRC